MTKTVSLFTLVALVLLPFTKAGVSATENSNEVNASDQSTTEKEVFIINCIGIYFFLVFLVDFCFRSVTKFNVFFLSAI